jgi:xanthine dehydrogenase molybdopterin-binding subunit B
MTYQQKLSPWVIHKLLPNLKQLAVYRFRRRHDAEAYLRVLQATQPHVKFAISFDVSDVNLVGQGE